MGEAARPSDRPVRSLADRVDHLFRSAKPPNGKDEYTHEQVAAALRGAGGPTISATYVWQLRKGIRDNPTKAHLEGVANFFGVAPGYFFDEESAERIEAELDLLAAMRDPDVRSIAVGVLDLSAGSIRAILGMVEQARRMEGLSDDLVDAAQDQLPLDRPGAG